MESFFSKYYAFPVLLFSIILLAGCSDNEVPDPAPSTQGSITAVVNGAAWASSEGNYKLGARTITKGASAFVGTGDTLTIIGVQVQGTDTTAVLLSVKLSADRVGSYTIRNSPDGRANGYFLTKITGNALKETKERYSAGIMNGELQITDYDASNYKVSGNFGFSISSTGETTYTIVAGKIENVTF